MDDRLGPDWTGALSTHFESPHTIRVGWLSPHRLTEVEEVIDLPAALSPVQVDDDGTTITRAGGGALAVSCTTGDGVEVRAVTAHLKSKLLSFPGGRFHTTDEGERVHALNRRAAEAAALREWATAALAGAWTGRPVLVCGDLNDTPDAATTQRLYGPPGSQFGTGGYGRPDGCDSQRLWGTGYWMTPPDHWSRINQGRPELIDNILVSHAMTERLRQARAPCRSSSPAGACSRRLRRGPPANRPRTTALSSPASTSSVRQPATATCAPSREPRRRRPAGDRPPADPSPDQRQADGVRRKLTARDRLRLEGNRLSGR